MAVRKYLMEGEHWRIARVQEFAAFFRALQVLDPPAAFLALADGSRPREVQESLARISADPGAAARELIHREFRHAVYVPVNSGHIATLAALAERHAESEIAIHFSVSTPTGRLAEWFDAPDDPIALSPLVLATAAARFAQECGTTCEWVGRGV